MDLLVSCLNGKVLRFVPRVRDLRVDATGGTTEPISPNLCLFSSPSFAAQVRGRRGYQSFLSSLVHRGSVTGCRHALEAFSMKRFFVPRADLPPCFTISGFDSVAIESKVLRDRVSGTVIPAMLKAFKSISWTIYLTWKLHFMAQGCELHLHCFWVAWTLAFLQWGIDQERALGTIMGKVSALTIFFWWPWLLTPWLITFCKGYGCISTLGAELGSLGPFRSLILRILEIFFCPGFRRRSPPWLLSPLLALLELTTLTCKSPYLVLHSYKVILCLLPSILSKIVSDFHLNKDIVLPAFCHCLSHPKEFALHSLNVIW